MPLYLGGDINISCALPDLSNLLSISDMSSYRRNGARAESRHSVFGRTLEYVVPGRRSLTMEITGFLNATDPGQNQLRAAERNNTNVYFQITYDPAGANGFYQLVGVSSFTHDATPDDLQTHGFVFVPVADPVIIGTGPLL